MTRVRAVVDTDTLCWQIAHELEKAIYTTCIHTFIVMQGIFFQLEHFPPRHSCNTSDECVGVCVVQTTRLFSKNGAILTSFSTYIPICVWIITLNLILCVHPYSLTQLLIPTSYKYIKFSFIISSSNSYTVVDSVNRGSITETFVYTEMMTVGWLDVRNGCLGRYSIDFTPTKFFLRIENVSPRKLDWLRPPYYFPGFSKLMSLHRNELIRSFIYPWHFCRLPNDSHKNVEPGIPRIYFGSPEMIMHCHWHLTLKMFFR